LKFIVTRTSVCGDCTPPCDGAVLEDCAYVDVRTVDCPTKILAYQGNPEKAKYEWYKKGKNHRVENGFIKRDLDDKAWFIEINSLEEMVELMKRVENPIILQSSYKNDNFLELEIYDYYRE
jgi:hypothetical protein